MSCNCGCHDDKPPATGWRRLVPLIVGAVVVGALIVGAVLKKEHSAGSSSGPSMPAAQERTADRPAPTSVSMSGEAGRVQWIGEMHAAVHEGDTAAKVALPTLLRRPHLSAIGPVEGLRGEITVIDGNASIGISDGKGGTATSQRDVNAAFLVWANVDEWVRVPLPDRVRTEADIEAFIPEAARAGGLSVDEPLPFRIEGRSEAMALHVIWQEPGTPPGKEAHDKAKVPRTLADAEVSIVGFWSGAHRGVFTPAFSDIHMHVITKDGAVSGHVESVRLAAGATLLLPAWAKTKAEPPPSAAGS